jgi:membrane associated rhomboid family serine protease
LVLIPLGFFTRVVHLPAIVVLGFWFVLQLISTALAPSDGGGVAWGAHVGGFIAGAVLIPFFKKSRVRLFS